MTDWQIDKMIGWSWGIISLNAKTFIEFLWKSTEQNWECIKQTHRLFLSSERGNVMRAVWNSRLAVKNWSLVGLQIDPNNWTLWHCSLWASWVTRLWGGEQRVRSYSKTDKNMDSCSDHGRVELLFMLLFWVSLEDVFWTCTVDWHLQDCM